MRPGRTSQRSVWRNPVSGVNVLTRTGLTRASSHWRPWLAGLVLAAAGSGVLRADFLTSDSVGPNIVHHHVFRSAGPWHIHVLEIALDTVWNHLQTVKADDNLYGNERTSSMAARHDAEGHRVVGAINGDFYNAGGIPVGAQVLEGSLLKKPYPTRSVFGYTVDRTPLIEVVTFQGQVLPGDGSVRAVQGINASRDSDELIVYNHFFGPRTGTNYWGTEVTIRYLTDQPSINDTLTAVVTAKDSVNAAGHGNNLIPAGGLVFSGHGTAGTFLNQHLRVGDTLEFCLQLPPSPAGLVELIGGTPRLIRDGAVAVEWQAEGVGQSFTYDRHPRTAVGIDATSTKVFLFTVDGRRPGYSVGMSLFELADAMLEWDIHQGVNLDGGGSTTMVVRGQVVNSPSDGGGERAVANALMVVSTAPTGPLARLALNPREVYVIVQSSLQFTVSGQDQYYNPVTPDLDSLVWSCDPQIGSINPYGLFLAGAQQEIGYVTVTCGNVVDSALVYVTDIASLELSPNPVILQVGEEQQMIPEARDLYGNILSLSPGQYDWSVQGGVGTVSATGLFTAQYTGQGAVTATYHSVAGSAAVTVGEPAEVILDAFESLGNWSLTGVNVNLAGCGLALDTLEWVSPPASGRLDYALVTGGTSALYMNCSLPISGSPDAVAIDVYGDGRGHWLRGEFQDADGEKFLVNFTGADPGIDWSGTWMNLAVDFEDALPHWGNPSAVLTYPVTWNKLYLAETDEARKDSGAIRFDDFRVRFITMDVDETGSIRPAEKILLEPCFPNPFNPHTTITCFLPERGPAELTIYNLLGQSVTTLFRGVQDPGYRTVHWNARNQSGEPVSSGVYLCRLRSGGITRTQRLVLLD